MQDLLTLYKSGADKADITGVRDYSKGQPVERKYPIFISSRADLDNYTNEYLYQVEKAFLKWVEQKAKDRYWSTHYKERTYTYGMLIEEIFGRKYDVHIDGGKGLSVSRMFAHYSSRTYNHFTDPITKKSKNWQTGYLISPTRWKNERPWSIRLQVEQLQAQGIYPTKDDIIRHRPLKKGTARNSETNKKIQERVKRGKKAWQERNKKQL